MVQVGAPPVDGLRLLQGRSKPSTPTASQLSELSDLSDQPQLRQPDPSEARGHRGRLWVAAACLWPCLAFFALIVPATPARMSRASAELVPRLPLWRLVAGIEPLSAVAPETLLVGLALVGGAAFLFYALALRMAWRAKSSVLNAVVIIVLSSVFFVTAFLALPTQNTDVFNYIVQGRVSAEYGQNQYRIPPNAFPDDPVLPFAGTRYIAEPNDYLPAWGLYNSTIAGLAGDDPVRALLVYRAGFVVLSICNLLLILGILSRTTPEHIPAGLVTYGWNPIVVLEGPSRVDTLMAFLALLAVFLFVRRRLFIGTAALTLSVLTKWITLPLMLSLVAGRAWRGEWRRLVGLSVVALVTTAVVYAPFVYGLDLFRDHFEMLLRGGSSAPEALRWILGGGLLCLVVWLARYHDGRGGPALWTWAVLLLYFTTFLTKIGFSWYLIVPAGVIALVRDGRLTAPFVALALGAFAYQVRYGAFNSTYEVEDLIPFAPFWVFVGLGLAGAVVLPILRSRGRNATRIPGPQGRLSSPARWLGSSGLHPGNDRPR